MRIHEFAKKNGLKNEELVEILTGAGFNIGSHMVTMSYDMVTAYEKRMAYLRAKAKAKAKPKAKAKAKAKPKAKAKAKAKAKPKTKVKVKAKTVEKVAEKPKVTVKVTEKVAEKPKVTAKVTEKVAEKPKVTAKAAEKVAEKPKVTAKAAEKVAEKPKVTAKAAEKVAEKPKAAEKPAARPKVVTKPESKAPAAGKAKSGKAAAEPARPKPPAKPDARTPAKAHGDSPSRPAAQKRAGQKTPTAKPAGTVHRPPPPAGKRPPSRRRETSTAQQKAVRESVRRTLAKIETTRRTKRRKSKIKEDVPVEDKTTTVNEGTTVRELAEIFNVEPEEVIKRCLDLGQVVTINQSLEQDTIEFLSADLDKQINFISETDEIESLLQVDAPVEPERLRPRDPIVTVMGHVDHGKTSILDYIRKSRVAVGEAGGITQHIGAYQVDTTDGTVAFIDTPGHEAFTSMRARGAQVTDIVVLVVAADDGVMPQTMEAINHAKAANVPVIVAINKIDLPSARPDQIKQQLSERGIVVEEFGGDAVAVEVSAKTGEGIDKLLEMILLQSELMELTADPDASAQAVAVEVKKEEGRGILCTVLVVQGTLRIGEIFVVGSHYGKVRALLDHRGKPVKEAVPSTPVVVLGCNGLPGPGDKLMVVQNEREARDLSLRRQQTQKERARKVSKKLTLEELYSQVQMGELKELRLVVKGDTNGSVEALTESLTKLSTEEVVVKIIHSGVGVVAESDVLLAASSEGMIIGFSVKAAPSADDMAEREKVEIKHYDIIYECLNEVHDAMTGMLEPEKVERVMGKAQVRKVFRISKLGVIAGSFVLEGSITRNALVRVVRDDEVVFEGKISSLKRFQDDVREVQKDFECGIGLTGYSGLQEGDILMAYVVEEHARVL